MSPTSLDDPPIRARIPADLDTPDRFVAGLSAHQLLVLALAAAPLYATWQGLAGQIPLPVLAALTVVVAGPAVALAMGRRDGLSLDRWLGAAIAHRLHPRRLAPSPTPGPPPTPRWAPPDPTGPAPRPAILRLPAEAISAEGVITTGPGRFVVLVAASTVTAALPTPGEQAAFLSGYARWLHSLTGPVQITVSARRVDLGARALHVAETAHRLGSGALAAAAIAHAEHLLDLTEDTDPLIRTITIACAAGTSGEALRRGEQTAAALGALGSRCRVLTGAEASAALASAVDPWGPSEPSWPRTPPGATVTAPGAVTYPPRPGDSIRQQRPAGGLAARGRAEDPRWVARPARWVGERPDRAGEPLDGPDDPSAWTGAPSGWASETPGWVSDLSGWAGEPSRGADEPAGWSGDGHDGRSASRWSR